jgi:endonuclease-3
MKRAEKAPLIYTELQRLYPNAHCELYHQNDFQLLIATILSAQCTDERVNMVTPILFESYPTAQKLAIAELDDLERIIRSTGFFKNKAKNIKGCAQAIVNKHQGVIPKDINELVKLPGVGRKTANVLLGNAYNINSGIVVDTHVKRISNLLGLTRHDDPIKIEKDLMKVFPRDQWTQLSHLLIFHGRRVCNARKPNCSQCTLRQHCRKT